MLTEFFDLNAWAQWFSELNRAFLFMLALPFVVAAIGFWSWWTEKEQEDRDAETAAAPTFDLPAVERERRVRSRRRDDVRRPAHQA